MFADRVNYFCGLLLNYNNSPLHRSSRVNEEYCFFLFLQIQPKNDAKFDRFLFVPIILFIY